MVCAMAGARRGRGFEPRFVCPSRGLLARPPPPPPSASRSTTGTAGASDGVSPHRFFVQLHGMLRLAVLSFIAGSQKKKAKPQPPHTCSSALHHRGRLCRRNRISSSYSSSARTRTHVFRAAAGCFAAVVHGPKDHIVHLFSQECFDVWYLRMVCNGGWACGPLTATLTPQLVLSID